MASPLLTVPWEECLLEPARDRAAETQLKRAAGAAPPICRYFLPLPWLAQAMVRLSADNGLLVHLDFAIADLIALAVSQENSCRYCYAATRAQLRVLGMSEARMLRLEQRLSGGELGAREAAAVRFARRMARANPLATQADAAALRAAGFVESELREIAFVVASLVFYNRISTIPALPPQTFERAPDLWFVRLSRPLLALVLRGWRQRGHAAAPVDAPAAGFARPIAALGDSPAAPVLARILQQMWASPALTPRCKALMFAVVGQGLGCRHALAEAGSRLLGEGIDAAALLQVVAHLDAPQLDDTERRMLAFVRDTIWYEPVQIQRRARALREQVSAAGFLEALGVASLANALCRLDAVLGEAP